MVGSTTIVSYTQFSTWLNCKHQWWLSYAKKLKVYTPTIHTCFGTAMHSTMQYYIEQQFKKSEEDINLTDRLFVELHEEFTKNINKYKDVFSNPNELHTFFNDGVNVLQYFKDHFNSIYNVDTQELVGIELPLDLNPSKNKPNLKFNAFLDITVRNKNSKIVIQDIKNTDTGWKKYMTADIKKISQLLLYRYFYSEVYNEKLSNIDMQYIFAKRNPVNGEYIEMENITEEHVSTSEVVDKFHEFIDTAFDSLGNPENKQFHADPGVNHSNCRFCEFATRFDVCPLENRKTIKQWEKLAYQ